MTRLKFLCTAMILSALSSGCGPGLKDAPPPAVVPSAPGFQQQTPGGEKAKTGPGGTSAVKPAD